MLRGEKTEVREGGKRGPASTPEGIFPAKEG